jgi:hypothetical protein
MIASDITLPDNAGYVAAAYLVFVVMLLIYLGVMAARVGRLERETAELLELSRREEAAAAPAQQPSAGLPS